MNTLITDNSGDQIDAKQSAFECNICMLTATNPVVTTCGHLFCWACIYHWLRSNQEFLTCPVCKNGIQTSKLIPVFNKNHEEQYEQGIPSRPRPKRSQQVPNPAAIGSGLPNSVLNAGSNLHKGVLLAGYGLFPSLSVLLFQVGNDVDSERLQQPSPEQSYQLCMKFLKYLVILIFVLVVIFC